VCYAPSVSSAQGTPDDAVFVGYLPPPTFAAIETTMFCNLSCHFCIQYQNGTTVSGPHMEPETFVAISDKLFPHLTSFQPSVSGEPLMSKGLDLVLEKAQRMAVRAEYYTNATLLRPKVIERILPTAGKINISFDGATKATYEALRAGASFDEVVANVKALVAAARELPDEHRPPIGFACTLMDRNIGELAALVDLAADLGLDSVAAAHVLPGTVEVQKQSVYHDLTHAATCIEQAVARARARNMPFSVQPLDQVIANLATTPDLATPWFRNPAENDGVVETLSGVAVLQGEQRPWPVAPPTNAEARYVRRESADDYGILPTTVDDNLPDSIWVCQYLWSRLYIGHEGNTVPCCVPGVPWLGNLTVQPLDEIWNGETERAMRVGMAQKSPADCCRGCQHVQEIHDPERIARYLGGKRLPSEPVLMPPDLRVVRGLPASYAEDAEAATDAPLLEWPAAEGSEQYVVQVSTDGFRNVAFSTDWHGILVESTSYRVPDWAWALAEPDQLLHWQCLAVLPDERRVVAHGAMRRTP
jgi:MoaA/NifB/PqqE/SkfB family radical SAM enzyme